MSSATPAPAVVEKGFEGGVDGGPVAAELERPSMSLILRIKAPGVPPVAIAQSSMAAAPSGKENGGTKDGESGGGKEGPPSGAIPRLRIACGPGQPMPDKPLKLRLLVPTARQGQASAGGHEPPAGGEAGAARRALAGEGETSPYRGGIVWEQKVREGGREGRREGGDEWW
eukprot:evm.model.NODE_31053_length_64317_cov_55.547771.7